MKKLLSTVIVAALALSFPVGSSAAESKTKTAAEKAADAAKKAADKTADAAKTAAEKVTGEAKTIPMYSRADVIDTKTKTFINNKKDGTSVKHVITDTTEIKNGEAMAKLSDIKVGDYVSGSRKKVSDMEYTVVKITKFGPKAPKEEGAEKPAEGAAKPAEKKTN